MAYCINTDVQNEFKSLPVGATGILTTDKIDGFIAQADAYIDGRLSTVYQTPITGSNSLLIVKQISIDLVAQRIAHIMEVKGITPKGDQYIPKNLGEKAENRLDMIVEKKILLSDATEVSTTGGVSSYTSENCVTRSFKQGEVQW